MDEKALNGLPPPVCVMMENLAVAVFSERRFEPLVWDNLAEAGPMVVGTTPGAVEAA